MPFYRCIPKLCFLDDSLRPRLKWLIWCECNTVDIWRLWMKLHVIGGNHLPYAHIPHSCMKALSDATSIGWFLLRDTYIPPLFLQFLAEVARRWPTSLSRCGHAISHACRPWVILPLIGCHDQTDIWKLRIMLAGHIRHWQTDLRRKQTILGWHNWHRHIDVYMIS